MRNYLENVTELRTNFLKKGVEWGLNGIIYRFTKKDLPKKYTQIKDFPKYSENYPVFTANLLLTPLEAWHANCIYKI